MLGHSRLLLAACLLLLTAATAAVATAWAEDAGSTDRRGEQISKDIPLAERAAKRMPQPVRVGDLHDRLVLEPSNHQHVLGRVDGVDRQPDGSVVLVVRYGGVLGLGARPIAVPIDAAALLGQFVQVTELDQAALDKLPTWAPTNGARLADNDVIRVGVNRN